MTKKYYNDWNKESQQNQTACRTKRHHRMNIPQLYNMNNQKKILPFVLMLEKLRQAVKIMFITILKPSLLIKLFDTLLENMWNHQKSNQKCKISTNLANKSEYFRIRKEYEKWLCSFQCQIHGKFGDQSSILWNPLQLNTSPWIIDWYL